MDMHREMWFDLTFRLSRACTMQDAIQDTEIFRAEYIQYTLLLSAGLASAFDRNHFRDHDFAVQDGNDNDTNMDVEYCGISSSPIFSCIAYGLTDNPGNS